MKKITMLLLAVSFGLGLLFTAGCSSETKELKAQLTAEKARQAAKDEASRGYLLLRKCDNGKKAEELISSIREVLKKQSLTTASIYLDEVSINSCRRDAYYRQSLKYLASLKTLRADGEEAKRLRAEINSAMRVSGRRVISDDHLNRLVAQNLLSEASGQRVKLGDADYRKSGLVPPAKLVVEKKPMRRL